MTKSKKNLVVIFSYILLCGLFSLTGCKNAAEEEAVAEAETAKIELTKVKAELASMISKGKDLKLKLAAVTEARDKLQGVAEQLGGLTKERDSAIAKAIEAQGMVEKLKSQLTEQIQKVTGLQDQNQKLQEMIDALKSNLGGEEQIPSIPEF